jgi:hypothetical protein
MVTRRRPQPPGRNEAVRCDEATAVARRSLIRRERRPERRLIGLLGGYAGERLATTEETQHQDEPLSGSAQRARLPGDLAQRGDRAGRDQTLVEFRAGGALAPAAWMAASFRRDGAARRFGEAETLANDALALGQRVQMRTAMLYFPRSSCCAVGGASRRSSRSSR